MEVLIQNSHHQTGRNDGWSGAPDEARYITFDLNPRIAAELVRNGVAVTFVDGDLRHHPVYDKDYDAFIACHYEADIHYSFKKGKFQEVERCGLVPPQLMLKDAKPTGDTVGHVGGWFWGRASSSLTAVKDDKLGKSAELHYKDLLTIKAYDLPYRAHWNNPNVTDYYAFRFTTGNTPGFLIELGVGSPTPHKGPDHDWLRNNVGLIAKSIAAGILQFLGVSVVPVTPVNNDKAVLGQTGHVREDLYAFAKAINPTFPQEWATLYANLCPQAGIRTSVAFAQMLKETDYGRFTKVAKESWNNPAGLGVTGPSDVGNRFPNKEAGVRAHLGHLLWYFGTHLPDFCSLDQRHFGEHKNLPNDATQMNGKWAVPGENYGESILAIAAKIKGDEMDRPQFDKWFNENLAVYKKALQDQLVNEWVHKNEIPTILSRVKLTLPAGIERMAGAMPFLEIGGKEKATVNPIFTDALIRFARVLITAAVSGAATAALSNLDENPDKLAYAVAVGAITGVLHAATEFLRTWQGTKVEVNRNTTMAGALQARAKTFWDYLPV